MQDPGGFYLSTVGARPDLLSFGAEMGRSDTLPHELLAQRILTSSTICRAQVALDRVAMRQRERDLHSSLRASHRLLQQHPGDTLLASQEALATAELARIQE